jgi:hypothetical protein
MGDLGTPLREQLHDAVAVRLALIIQIGLVTHETDA